MEAPPRPGRFPVSDGFEPELLRYGSMRISNPRKKESPKKGGGEGENRTQNREFQEAIEETSGLQTKVSNCSQFPSGFQKEKLITVGRYGSKECEKILQSEDRNGQEINRRNSSATK
jgi:hypothetical protein